MKPMSDQPDLSFRTEPAGESPARDLLSAVEAELVELYGFSTIANTPSATPEDFGQPGAGFLVLYRGEDAIACGGVKQIGPGMAEIKRMYVVPAERSRGHARRLLTALEELAARLGHTKVRLDTGNRQPHALALYSSAGYREIPDYNENVYASYWFEKDL
jgi:GNAT superfamily N-acetyltransferase